MTKQQIELRRQQLSEEFLALPDGWSSRGLKICEEFGQFAEEEEDNLKRGGGSDQISEIAEAEERSR
jgi:hypothetical protein